MSQTASARTTTHRATTPIALVLFVAAAAIIGTFVVRSAPTSAPSFIDALRHGRSGAAAQADGAVTEDDGVLPEGVTVFDDGYPGVANLDPHLLQVLRQAATDAAANGITFYVNSGWRSPEFQNQLLREAIAD